ncbi:hypothetical protein AYO20_03731 [Fonsecaea nubica]|uniref:Antigenic thaumatin-like protein n=2 Tax=Fonsecaea TaxID=40354 RepID=A0A0D2H4H3_9EURO|nr:uncharacterized protein Z517_01182 [Fonsecaea pedrosoi CBS 271.37]XP_022501974.1 hypothetical protein AYO20_03731 [Fonsecaea nubica]KIW85790.1 hypothetical protein Z517_01182 [Fonsecaea pedrosoi CBS 271.37]OAL36962.1 hypothetical protein AYO20_03731 [Fonsecaea nubica]
MQFKNFVAGAAVLLASAPAVLALGTATVVNNCGYPVYYASVGGSSNPNMQQLQGSYSEGYGQEGVGVSIKLAPNATTSGPISQFEFTWANGKISYDLSNINGYPFSAGGMQIVPSMQNDPSNPTCVVVDCPAGEAVCTAAYNAPDDTRTMVCNEEANLVLTICPGGSSKRSVAVNEGQIHYRVHARHLPKMA